jgi:hypothetical protein
MHIQNQKGELASPWPLDMHEVGEKDRKLKNNWWIWQLIN